MSPVEPAEAERLAGTFATADPVTDLVNETVNRVRERIETFDFQAAAGRTTHWIRENPAISAAIAVGLAVFVVYSVRRAAEGSEEPAEASGRGAGVLRRTASEFGSEIASVAERYEKTAAKKAADIATNMASRAGVQTNGTSNTGNGVPALSETIRSAIASVVLNRISDWLRRP